MQVVILCGGMGTRIRDVSDDLPKPMIAIGDRPILWHIMSTYARHGFKDFILCLGYKGWTIKRWFLDYHLANSDFSLRMGRPEQAKILESQTDDWNITFAETGLNAMTGCRVKRIEKYIRGDRFFLTYGDGLADVDLHALLKFHRSHGHVGTVTAVRPPGRFGEMEISGRQVTSFMEKPRHAPGRISGGYFVFERSFFSRLADDESSILELGPLADLTNDGELMAWPHDGFWHPLDNSRDHQHLNGLWSQGDAAWMRINQTPARLAA